MTKRTDANGYATRYTYDIRGRLTTTTFPDTSTVVLAYDANGHPISRTNQLGKVVTYAYDDAGRLTAVTAPARGTTAYTYDRLASCCPSPMPITTPRPMPTMCMVARSRRRGRVGTFEHYGYDLVGNRTSVRLADGQTNTYTYDTRNRLTGIAYFGGPSVSFTFTPTGQRATATDARGTTTYAYDNRDDLTGIALPGGQAVGYTYDLAGNQTAVTTPAGTTAYNYDGANRLIGLTAPGSIGAHLHLRFRRQPHGAHPDRRHRRHLYL